MQVLEEDMAATWMGEWSVVVQTLRAIAAICEGYSANAFTRRSSEENRIDLWMKSQGPAYREMSRASKGDYRWLSRPTCKKNMST